MGGVPALSDEILQEAIEAVKQAGGNQAEAARNLNIPDTTLKSRMKLAAKRGLMGFKPVLEGFEVSQISTTLDAEGNVKNQHIQQKQERLFGPFNMPAGHVVKGVSALLDANGNVSQQWVKTTREDEQRDISMRAAIDALKEEIEPMAPIKGPDHCNELLANQFTLTDNHLGMLAWGEESGEDYDLKIAEKLVMDWIVAAIAMAPNAGVAILAIIGDLLHYDSLESQTPENRHVLDADSRFPKMVRAAIRILRQVVPMLAQTHERVHIIIADDNHSPASAVWLREFLSVLYQDNPRISVDTSPSTYYVYRHGNISLFYHHGHKRGVKNIDHVFAGQFREIYGATKHSYAHIGHLHSDEVLSTNLMKVERHETLAAKDAYAARGGWLSKRSAKVITYHKEYGEVSRITLTPEMVTK